MQFGLLGIHKGLDTQTRGGGGPLSWFSGLNREEMNVLVVLCLSLEQRLAGGKENIPGTPILLSLSPTGSCQEGLSIESSLPPPQSFCILGEGSGSHLSLFLNTGWQEAQGEGSPIGNLQLPVFKVKLP